MKYPHWKHLSVLPCHRPGHHSAQYKYRYHKYNERINQLKQKIEQKQNSNTNTIPLKNIKKSIETIKFDIKQMNLQIEVMNNRVSNYNFIKNNDHASHSVQEIQNYELDLEENSLEELI